MINRIEGVIFLPVPAEDPSFLVQSFIRFCSRIGSHDEGEGPVEPLIDAEVDDPLKDTRVIVIESDDKGSHESDSLIPDPSDCLGVSSRLVKALSHGLKILDGEGLKTNIQSNASTLRKPRKKYFIKGNRNRGVPPPKEIVIFKKGKEVETESFVASDIRVDDIEKSPFEKVGQIFTEERKDLFRDGVHHGGFRKKSLQLPINIVEGTIAVLKSKKPRDTAEVAAMRTSPRGFK